MGATSNQASAAEITRLPFRKNANPDTAVCPWNILAPLSSSLEGYAEFSLARKLTRMLRIGNKTCFITGISFPSAFGLIHTLDTRELLKRKPLGSLAVTFHVITDQLLCILD